MLRNTASPLGANPTVINIWGQCKNIISNIWGQYYLGSE
jgi:hypothetical protein